MAPLAVDPAALDSAGGAVVAAGAGLGAVISSLTAALAGCAGMAGDDPAGAVFGRSYDGSAAALVQAMSVARNGLCNLGDGVRMSAHNYSLAEAMSDVAGRAAPLPAPPPSGCVGVGAPPSAVGGGGGAPKGWGWVAPYIGMIWPNGDSTKLRAAAVAWRSAGTQFALTEIQSTAGPMGVIRAQQLPEAGLIESAFADAYASRRHRTLSPQQRRRGQDRNHHGSNHQNRATRHPRPRRNRRPCPPTVHCRTAPPNPNRRPSTDRLNRWRRRRRRQASPGYPQPPRPAHMCRMACRNRVNMSRRKHHRRRRCLADLLSSQRPLPRTNPSGRPHQQHPRRRRIPRPEAFTQPNRGLTADH